MDRVPEPSETQAGTSDDSARAPLPAGPATPAPAGPANGVPGSSGSYLPRIDGNAAGAEAESADNAPDDEPAADQPDRAEDGLSPEADESATTPITPQAESLTKLTIAQLKDKIMASTPSTEEMHQVSDTIKQAVAEAQTRAKAAYEKGTEAMTEVTELAKGNVEALVESTKIIAAGMQDIGRTYAEEAKAAYEQITADMKELAAIKSPTELFQLQGKIMRRNFDSLVAASSKNTEAMMKLVNEAFAPLSSRMSAAAEKMTKMP
ncbi:MAG: phasin family protein [Porphyrobacter sp.]|nr:phasin family protein [Porphyrobacter sp.]